MRAIRGDRCAGRLESDVEWRVIRLRVGPGQGPRTEDWGER
jgi:hypothetical protein